MPQVILIVLIAGNVSLLAIAAGLHVMLRSPLATGVPLVIMCVLTGYMIKTGNHLSRR